MRDGGHVLHAPWRSGPPPNAVAPGPTESGALVAGMAADARGQR